MPALGTCAGFQHMVIEFACNALGFRDADSEENGAERADTVISRLSCTLMNQKEQLEMTDPNSPLARTAGADKFIGEYRCLKLKRMQFGARLSPVKIRRNCGNGS